MHARALYLKTAIFWTLIIGLNQGREGDVKLSINFLKTWAVIMLYSNPIPELFKSCFEFIGRSEPECRFLNIKYTLPVSLPVIQPVPSHEMGVVKFKGPGPEFIFAVSTIY